MPLNLAKPPLSPLSPPSDEAVLTRGLLVHSENLGELAVYLGLDAPRQHIGGQHVGRGHLCATELVGLDLRVLASKR